MDKEQAEQWEKEYDKAMDKTMSSIIPGKKYRLFYNEGNRNNKLMHIITIVDDEYFVWKEWWRKKQRWLYHVEHFWSFFYYLEDDKMAEVK